MTIDAAKLLDYPFPTSEHSYTARDAMLYALGVGLGSDPTDEAELPYVYERNLTVLPTMAAVIGHPGPWFRDPATGIDWVHVVHGEQSLEIHAPPLHPDNPPLRCETQVVDVEDKGPGRGASSAGDAASSTRRPVHWSPPPTARCSAARMAASAGRSGPSNRPRRGRRALRRRPSRARFHRERR